MSRWVVVLGVLTAGCTLDHQDTALRGGPDGVDIGYAGDINETLPLARQHCARYERVPLFRQAKENHAYYACVPKGAS
ncbi:MAG TPA: hypothetical protein VM782_15630 [Stellaceae bacterium]|nr:hypothetical protein [Stellaceae bacterium]